MTKTCRDCQTEKPLDDFHKAPKCLDGRRPICRECVAAANRARRTANPEKDRERDRKRYAEQPERRAKQKATARAFYAANKERQQKLKNAYYYAHKDRWVIYRATRQARLEDGRPREPYTRKEVYERGEGRCAICGIDVPYERGGFQIDHVVPIALGGADTLANLQLTCPPCNWSKWRSAA